MKKGKAIFLLCVLVFLYAPILILVVYSFTDATQIGAIRGLSFHNYVTLFTTPELTGMIVGTVCLALGRRPSLPCWERPGRSVLSTPAAGWDP